MKSIRCKNCNKLLFKADSFDRIEIKCARCKRHIVMMNAREHPTENHCGKREEVTHSDKTERY